MEKHEQWSFLTPWCDMLKGHVNYMGHECRGSSFMERSLYIELPMRIHTERFTEDVDLASLSDTDREVLFRKKFQKSREAMALLAAVAHADYAAWRYLLETHCSVNFGVEGEPIYEKKIPIRYVVTLDLGDRTWDFETHDYDLVLFFGVHQRLHPSGEYREALQLIAALDKNPLRSKSDFDFDVPVRVDFGLETFDTMVDVGIAEKIVQQQ
ncbi:hypothetical protein PF005_g11341 [Phytophthora fragariae]|uniref:Uncharacterized protein n=2 Tax=Phytophthora fragariae TaxID=53985 RepID=A0A6A3EDZ6_9STRA|nr:hypothetical protein PF003_g40196 [Phytophthora fragariae]KAE8931832.1 hypothetical protein PF009_g18109 [Phytophthora fragariae]KAE9104786.1 hypothetical protein PF010_g13257 [Phytophthora fragariae]KAE9109909.1 hypothetical protein PF007_g12063 [Phytophthora fragariae]KAE9140889.1 hypothetical protein PF006_g13434 [Phytophthora fragariae]